MMSINKNLYLKLKFLKKKGSLRDEINRKKASNTNFDFDLISKWIKDVINGLCYLHKIDTIHRDIKPE